MELGYPADTFSKISNPVIYKDDELWIEAVVGSASFMRPAFRNKCNGSTPKQPRVFKEPGKKVTAKVKAKKLKSLRTKKK